MLFGPLDSQPFADCVVITGKMLGQNRGLSIVMLRVVRIVAKIDGASRTTCGGLSNSSLKYLGPRSQNLGTSPYIGKGTLDMQSGYNA